MPREGSGGIPGTSPRDPMAAKIENVASRAAGNGARIQNLRAESTRNQVSLLNRVNKTAISRATPVGGTTTGAPECGTTDGCRGQVLWHL
jgi:hypothetical protein